MCLGREASWRPPWVHWLPYGAGGQSPRDAFGVVAEGGGCHLAAGSDRADTRQDERVSGWALVLVRQFSYDLRYARANGRKLSLIDRSS
jgi:hypothetical protein